MSNGFIVSNKDNIFLKKTLDKIYTNCLLQKKGKTSLYPTGPAILAEIYNQHKSDDMGGIYIGKHIKDENDLYHFFDHNDKKFLKTKYTQENGKEFSAGSWDKFDNIKGKLPKIATVTQARVENKKVCLKLSFKSFSRLANIHKIPINIVTKDADIKL